MKPEVTLMDIKDFAAEVIPYNDYMAITEAEKEFEKTCRIKGTRIDDMIEMKKVIWATGIKISLRGVKG